MEQKKIITRTVKQKFLAADKSFRILKSVGLGAAANSNGKSVTVHTHASHCYNFICFGVTATESDHLKLPKGKVGLTLGTI